MIFFANSLVKIKSVKYVVKLVVVTLWLFLLFYLLTPSGDFPAPPPDAFQSQEPADTETSFRRAYFTNYSREEVIAHYKKQISHEPFSFLLQQLNYPPEDAQLLIRDQTRSTFLEELAYPWRESLYINGFEPRDPKDDIWYRGTHYRQKITIKYVPSLVSIRIVLASLTLIFTLLLIQEFFSGYE